MPSYDDIITYIVDKKYPSGYTRSAKRDLRKRASDFILEKEILYYKGSRGKNCKPRQVIRDKKAQERVVKQCHEGNGSAHFGRDRTLEKIETRFYWFGMYGDVLNYISSCDTCQRQKPKLKKAMPPMHPVPVPSGAWKQVGIDLIGPLPETRNGKKYIITMVDYFTKWAEAAALPDKSAKEVADFIYWTITRNGCAEVQISDQGREFVNSVNSLLHDRTGTEHRVTSAYHPQSNGLTERFNQTLQTALKKTVNDRQNDWDDYIDDVLFAYRTSRQESTRHSPFYLMHGREARLPVEMELASDTSTSPADLDSRISELSQLRNDYTEASKNISNAQQTQKKQHDKRNGTNQTQFEVGCLVLKKDAREAGRKGGKLKPVYTGPYKVIKHAGKNVYFLQDEGTGRKLKTKVNAALLKPYVCHDSLFWKKDLNLRLTDKAILTNPDEMLTDAHMMGAMKLLNKAFPSLSPCQDTLLSQSTGFDPVQKAEFVQILHVGGNHWVTVGSDGFQVTVYDSLSTSLQRKMTRTKDRRLSSEIELMIAQLVHNRSHGEISVSVPKVQQQTDGVSCGLFAVAFAVEAALGSDLMEIRFDEGKMREHLLSCMEAEKLTAFPKVTSVKTRRRVTAKSPETVIQVYCKCRLPASIDGMLQCGLCSEWLHYKCIGITAKEAESLEHWECSECAPPSKRPKI